jgi:hypothetical protein
MTEKQEQQFRKLIGFVKQLAEQHNELECWGGQEMNSRFLLSSRHRTSRFHRKTEGSSTLTATDRNSPTLASHVLESKYERCRRQVLFFQQSVA